MPTSFPNAKTFIVPPSPAGSMSVRAASRRRTDDSDRSGRTATIGAGGSAGRAGRGVRVGGGIRRIGYTAAENVVDSYL